MVQLGTVTIPVWTTGWKMQRALAHAGVSVEQMAHELGVSRSTVSRWLNDRGTPSRGYLTLWAQRTGVPFEWLADVELPRQDLNLEPAGWRYPADGDRYLTDGEVDAARGRVRGLIRRGTFDPSAVAESTVLPIAAAR